MAFDRSDRSGRCPFPLSQLLTAISIAFVGLAGTARAQVVAVHAFDERTRDPAPSAIVSLIAADGRTVDRMLTDLLGRATLRPPGGGVYRVQGDRIGYTSTLSGPITLTPGGDTVIVRLALGAEQVRLPDLIARGSQVACGVDGVAGSTLADAWVEAQKGLTSTTLTTDVVRPLLELRTFERERDLRGRITSDRTIQVRRTNGSPFVTVDPALLWREGFTRPDGDMVVYYAPDAALLLMDEFLEYHCFRLVYDERDHRGSLGLGFEPLPDRDVPEIEGTLWLNLNTAALQEIEFAYVNLDQDWPDGVEAGGQVSFRVVPGVGWVVDSWFIRTPRLSRMVPQLRGFRNPERLDHVGYFETGGEVQIVTQPKGPSVIAGTVWDSVAGGPLPGARVALSSGEPSTVTDSMGRFQLELLAEGKVDLVVEHPRLSLFGIGAPETTTIARGLVARVDLGIPSREVVLSRLCTGRGEDPSLGALLGLVVDSLGRPQEDVSIEVRWTAPVRRGEDSNPGIAAGQQQIGTGTDEGGRFSVCGVPVGASVTLMIGDDGSSAETFTMDEPLVTVTRRLRR